MADFPCEICGQPIDPERLEFVPLTRLCAQHAKMIVKHGGEFFLASSAIKGNKAGGMKGNIIGVDVVQIRNVAAMRKLRTECGLSNAGEDDPDARDGE